MEEENSIEKPLYKNTSCGHYYHINCLKEWLNSASNKDVFACIYCKNLQLKKEESMNNNLFLDNRLLQKKKWTFTKSSWTWLLEMNLFVDRAWIMLKNTNSKVLNKSD